MLGRGRREERRDDRREERADLRSRRATPPSTRCARRCCRSATTRGSRTLGRRAFKVNGKAVRLRRTLVLEDANGAELFKIQERPVRVRDVMEIEAPAAARRRR